MNTHRVQTKNADQLREGDVVCVHCAIGYGCGFPWHEVETVYPTYPRDGVDRTVLRLRHAIWRSHECGCECSCVPSDAVVRVKKG